jgi:1-acyl-sn-glycerol-3-phosphate acyltransferase
MAGLRALFALEVNGARSIPAEGPAILVANHQGYLDPLFLQTATTRPVRYMMTSDFYDLPRLRPFFRFVRAIRVNENGPSRDSFREATAVLNSGGLIGLFPEGRLSDDGGFGELLPGIAFLAGRSGAPVVPARIRGSFHVWPRGRRIPRQKRVSIRFGTPFRVESPRARGTSEKILAAWERL